MNKRDADTTAAMHACENALALLEQANDYDVPALRRRLVQALQELDNGSAIRARRLIVGVLEELDRGMGQKLLKTHAYIKAVWYSVFYAPYSGQKGQR